jgi:hypothetical protein
MDVAFSLAIGIGYIFVSVWHLMQSKQDLIIL